MYIFIVYLFMCICCARQSTLLRRWKNRPETSTGVFAAISSLSLSFEKLRELLDERSPKTQTKDFIPSMSIKKSSRSLHKAPLVCIVCMFYLLCISEFSLVLLLSVCLKVCNLTCFLSLFILLCSIYFLTLSLSINRAITGKKIVRLQLRSFLWDELVVVDGFQALLTRESRVDHIEALWFSIARVVLATVGTFLRFDGCVIRGGFLLLDFIRVVEGGCRRCAEFNYRFVQRFVLPRFGPGGDVLDVDQFINVVVATRVRISALNLISKNFLKHWNVPVVDAAWLSIGLETNWDLFAYILDRVRRRNRSIVGVVVGIRWQLDHEHM